MAVVSETDEVLFSIRDGVATITLNRPDRLNAFTMDGVVTICKRLRESADDENVGVIVITGAGEKAFCTGGIALAPATKSICFAISPSRQNTLGLVRQDQKWEAFQTGG